MWYPTLNDVLEIYERIAGAYAPAPKPRDEGAVDRLVMAPQWAGGEKRTIENIARKTAEILSCAVEDGTFQKKNVHVGYALAALFLEKNDFTLRTDLETVHDQLVRLQGGDLEIDELAAWIGSQLERKEKPFNAKRVFSALHRIATVMEELEDHADMERHADQLDAAGYTICAEMVDAFDPSENTRGRILRSYPAIDEHWGEVFEDKGLEAED